MNDVMKEYHKKAIICEILEYIAYKIDDMESGIRLATEELKDEQDNEYYKDRIDTLQVKIGALRDIAKKL